MGTKAMDFDRLKWLLYISVFPVCFTLVGGYLLIRGMLDYQLGYAANNWPATTGTITASSVAEDDHGDETTYLALVLYTYSVDAKDFRNDEIYAGYGGSSNKATALAMANKYAVGNSVSVLYNPDSPANAVLESGIGISTYIMILFSLPIVFIGGALLRLLPAEWRQK